MKESQLNKSKVAWGLILIGLGFLLGTVVTGRGGRYVVRPFQQQSVMNEIQAELDAVRAELANEQVRLQELTVVLPSIPEIPPVPTVPPIPSIVDDSHVYITVDHSPFRPFSRFTNLAALGMIGLGIWLVAKRNKTVEDTYKTKA